MKRRMAFLFLIALVAAVGWPAAASATAANNEAGTYVFALEEPNVAQAPNGDTIGLVGEGQFSVHPKSASGGGTLTYTRAGSATFEGTWTVNRLVAFQPYGCGVFFGTPIPDFLCGGRLVLDVTATTPYGARRALVTVYCLIGIPPPSAEEGIRVVVPQVANFNRVISGDNVFIKQ